MQLTVMLAVLSSAFFCQLNPRLRVESMMPRILIVEDDPTLRMALRDTLETAEFQVFEAENGKEGLLQLMHQDIDVVVSDVQMDEMDGEQLLRATREKFPQFRS